MPTFNLTFEASVEADGETKSIASTAAIAAENMITGKQTVGNSYEKLGQATTTNSLVIIYNPSTNDVSVQMELATYTTNRYLCYNLIAGGIMVVHRQYLSDTGSNLFTTVTNLQARTNSGTADLEYLILK